MKIKKATPNKNEFAKFEIIIDKKYFKNIVDYAVESYIRNDYDLDLYDRETIINDVSKCEHFKKNVVSDMFLELKHLLPEHIFNNAGFGPAWEDSPICKKIEQDLNEKRSKKEESKEINEAKKILEKFGYEISKQ